MKYISLFSGIECASVAVKPLGWEAICFAEIEPFPSAVLAHHYPDVPNVGDVTAHDWSQYRSRCDVVIGGSPCQAFSVAGRRESLADARGNLTLAFVEAVNAIDPAFVVWENVPGVLNTRDNAFGCFLAALAGDDRPLDAPDGGAWSNAGVVVGSRRALAWRILDAQYFGVPQRRRRVFVVGCPRIHGIDPSEILFEAKGGRGDSSARREAEKDIAGSIEASIGRGRCAGISPGAIVGAVSAKWAKGTGGPAGDECQNLLVAGTLTGSLGCAGPDANDAARGMYIAHTLRGEGFDASEDGTGRGTPLVFDTTQITSAGNYSNPKPGDPCHPLAAGAHPPVVAFHGSQDPDVSDDVTHPVGRNQGQETCIIYAVSTAHTQANGRGVAEDTAYTLEREQRQAVAVALRGRDGGGTAELGGDVSGALRSAEGGGSRAHVLTNIVRRFTPRECERLQGLPDDYTFVPWRGGMATDGPRYKAIGNGMAVPCVLWILERIEKIAAEK